MVILTTTYNCEEYIEECINSIKTQTFTDFKCYITDDMSTDNTVNKVKELIEGDNRFILIENESKLYQPGNYDQVIRGNTNIDDDEVIIEVDGDDWLSDNEVFDRINSVYLNSEVWIANGSFKYSDGTMGFSSFPRNFENVRHENFTASHIRTWRAFLWRAIEVESLKDEHGNYWEVAGDLSFMYPMLEMSGPDHYHFMEEVNYIYNGENPLNDHKVNIHKVMNTTPKLRGKSKYQRLIR